MFVQAYKEFIPAQYLGRGVHRSKEKIMETHTLCMRVRGDAREYQHSTGRETDIGYAVANIHSGVQSLPDWKGEKGQRATYPKWVVTQVDGEEIDFLFSPVWDNQRHTSTAFCNRVNVQWQFYTTLAQQMSGPVFVTINDDHSYAVHQEPNGFVSVLADYLEYLNEKLRLITLHCGEYRFPCT